MTISGKEIELRQHRVCFTGHRLWKVSVVECELRMAIKKAIYQAINRGYCTFISGMAQGYDIIAAEEVLQAKKYSPHIHLICALPHPDFHVRWSISWQERYLAVLNEADYIKLTSSSYTSRCYQTRNEWMVLHSSLVIAFYAGIPGGTKNTIDFANSKGIEVQIIEV